MCTLLYGSLTWLLRTGSSKLLYFMSAVCHMWNIVSGRPLVHWTSVWLWRLHRRRLYRASQYTERTECQSFQDGARLAPPPPYTHTHTEVATLPPKSRILWQVYSSSVRRHHRFLLALPVTRSRAEWSFLWIRMRPKGWNLCHRVISVLGPRAWTSAL